MSKFCVQAGWDHAPHLSEKAKADLLAEVPAWQRDARSKGKPTLGAGAIYPVDEDLFVVQPHDLPEHWARGYGLDVGWNRTAGVWGARDRETDTVEIYAEHYMGRAEASDHAKQIRGKGEWIPGVIDPASRGRSQVDGQQLMQNYIDLGLDLDKADNTVSAGIDLVWMRLVSGRLKVWSSCVNWLNEFRKYRRDDKGHVVKVDDHLMDATRYLVVSGIERMKTQIRKQHQPFRGGAGRVFTG